MPWMIALGDTSNRGGRSGGGSRAEAHPELMPDGGNKHGQHIYDPGKFMPSSPVSPGTPEQPGGTSASLEEARSRGRRTRSMADMKESMKGRIGFLPESDEDEEDKMRGGQGGSGGESSRSMGYAESHHKEDGGFEHLKKTIKKLKERLEKAEQGGEGFAQVSEIGLEGDKLFKKLPHLGRKALKVLRKPPETWTKYLEDEDFESIYDMEVKELEKAVQKAQKADEGEDKSVDKEITHVFASLLLILMNEEED